MSLKKEKRWDEANKLWEKLSTTGKYCLFALDESAKYFEHIEKNFEQALVIVDNALKRFEIQKELGYLIFEPEWHDRFLKRRQRLADKIYFTKY